MRDKTNGYAADTIQNEGLEYAVRHYIDGNAFKDPKTELLWTDAALILDALCEHLSSETGRDVGNE